jgi:S1-C subfamily serine protease
MTHPFILALLALTPTAPFPADTAHHSAVWVVTPSRTGAGFLLDRNLGLLVTAHHVIRDRPSVRVVFPEYQGGKLLHDRQWYRDRRDRLGIPGKIIRVTTERDLALIQVDDPSRIPPSAVPVRLANAEPQPGNRVHLISGVPTTRQSAFEHVWGTVHGVRWRSSVTTNPRARREIHSSLPSRSGNSGAAVLDNRGKLVGVHVARNRSTGVAVAVGLTEVRPFLLPPVGNFPNQPSPAQVLSARVSQRGFGR